MNKIITGVAISLISSAIAALVVMANAALTDTQLEEISNYLVEEPENYNVLLRRMRESGQFIGERGAPGEKGNQGDCGVPGKPGLHMGASTKLENPEINEWHRESVDHFVVVNFQLTRVLDSGNQNDRRGSVVIQIRDATREVRNVAFCSADRTTGIANSSAAFLVKAGESWRCSVSAGNLEARPKWRDVNVQKEMLWAMKTRLAL